MIDALRFTSAILTFLVGVTITVLWIIAAFDRGKKVGQTYECWGCNYLFNQALNGSVFTQAPYNYNTGLNNWMKSNRNPYPLLIAFGAIVGVFWIIIGIFGFFATSRGMAKTYLIFGALNFIIFVVVFPIILERIYFIQPYCTNYLWPAWCRTDIEWQIKHGLGSFDLFWGAALAGFIIGAFQLASAVYLLYATYVVSYVPPYAPPHPAAPAERTKV